MFATKTLLFRGELNNNVNFLCFFSYYRHKIKAKAHKGEQVVSQRFDTCKNVEF